MRTFRADLHIHTLLSPCGNLEMSPNNIIRTAKALQLDIIGITDHNSTRHCALAAKLGREQGLVVLTGAEVTSREEVHCLAFFETAEAIAAFQIFLDEHLPYVPNNPDYFGDQVVIDEEEVIVDEPPMLLLSALTAGITEIEQEVHRLGGLFIPAHADRPSFSLISQLGFIPVDLNADAIEIHRNTDPDQFRKQHGTGEDMALIKSSDAHMLRDIGRGYTVLLLEEPCFSEIRKALSGDGGRKVMAA
jgi:3',5'-nucleoside bisphosphate phosphatase